MTVFWLWVFISLGQAYPLAHAYGPLLRGASCSCQASGKACRHGCLIKKKPKSQKNFPRHFHAVKTQKFSPKVKRVEPCHENHNNQKPLLASKNFSQNKTLNKKQNVPQEEWSYVSPHCGQGRGVKGAISFYSEFFMPSKANFIFALRGYSSFEVAGPFLSHWVPAPQSPPPRA